MGNYFADDQTDNKGGFFHRNKGVSFAVIIACMLFIITFFLEKSKIIIDMVPILRGEVSLERDFSITTTKEGYPLVIKKNDPTVGSKVRFFGDIRSVFSETAMFFAKKGDLVAEVGPHFGYNLVRISKKLGEGGRYYAFEPNNSIFSRLRKSVVLNDLEEIAILRNVAISNKTEIISVPDCLSKIKTEDGIYKKNREINVTCSTLDKELAGETRQVSLLLIDVPGFEFATINGAEKILASSSDVKIIIYLDRIRASKNANEEAELNKLKARGFLFYLVNDHPDSCAEVGVFDILSKEEAVIVMTKKKLDSRSTS
ncbi:MAG: FkbM family methyltransferase [Holosporaceae bacterium]|nr:FkbM family methyltransferase [Holosporaceae bacterium]